MVRKVLDKPGPPGGSIRNWMPDLKIVSDLFKMSLAAAPSGIADRWLVDDIIAKNGDAQPAELNGLELARASQGKSSENVKGPRRQRPRSKLSSEKLHRGGFRPGAVRTCNAAPLSIEMEGRFSGRENRNGRSWFHCELPRFKKPPT